jgi:hypothetical protein
VGHFHRLAGIRALYADKGRDSRISCGCLYVFAFAVVWMVRVEVMVWMMRHCWRWVARGKLMQSVQVRMMEIECQAGLLVSSRLIVRCPWSRREDV